MKAAGRGAKESVPPDSCNALVRAPSGLPGSRMMDFSLSMSYFAHCVANKWMKNEKQGHKGLSL